MIWIRLNHKIPPSIWRLGFVTLLMNLSTVIIFSLSPLYLTAVLGVSIFHLGIIEGIVELTSWIMRLVSGIISDFLRKRKLLLFIAYSIAAVARPIFALVPVVGWVVFARLLDRIGNGLQASPREALVADLAPPDMKGACYGLRQSLAMIGSLLGALVIVYVMHRTGEDYTAVFWVATVPPILAVITLLLFVKDAPIKMPKAKILKFHLSDIKKLDRHYWSVVGVAAIFMLANYSGAFMILEASSQGLTAGNVSLVMVLQNFASMIAAYPIGRYSDKVDRRIPLAIGFFLVIISDIFFAMGMGPLYVLIGAFIWGIQLGITQSLLVAKVADNTPKEVLGSAFGFYYILMGLSLYISNNISGWLSENWGNHYVFWNSAVIVSVALLGLLFLKPKRNFVEVS